MIKTLTVNCPREEERFQILPRDAMRKRGLCCRPVSVCPSVCLSVTFMYCIQMAKDIVKLLSTSAINLVFLIPSTDTQFQGQLPQRGR